MCSFVKNDSLINGCVCKLHKASVGSELPNTFLLYKHRRNKTSLSWPELKVSRGRRDRATDHSNLLWHKLREWENVLDLIIPLHVCRKKMRRIWKWKAHLCPSVGFQSIECQMRQGIRQDTCMWERGGRRVFFSVPLLVFLKRAEDSGSLWTPTGKQLYRVTVILNSTDTKSTTRTLRCLTPHTLQHCTPTRDEAQTL